MKKEEPKTIAIGQIVGAFGIKGEVKVDPWTDFEARFEKGRTLLIDGKPFRIAACRYHKGRPLLSFAEVKTANDAEAMQWKELHVPADDKPELEEDEFFTEDLIGMSVVTVDGLKLGKLDDVLSSPAHDILVVGAVMIPAVKEFVKQIDFDRDRIVVKLIPGMRNESDAEIA